MPLIKKYNDRIPACGIFCGGCPVYVRDKKPCPGAGINIKRCEGCKTFHLCCKSRNITHCYECETFPCRKFKDFAKRWLKYGQDMHENQKMLKERGVDGFCGYFNSKVDK